MLSGTALANRKFQTGKQAKKRAEQMTIQNEFMRQQEKNHSQQRQLDGTESNHVIGYDCDNQVSTTTNTTTLSLMDQHLMKKSKQQVEEVNVGRKAFDRERVSDIYIVCIYI